MSGGDGELCRCSSIRIEIDIEVHQNVGFWDREGCRLNFCTPMAGLEVAGEANHAIGKIGELCDRERKAFAP